MRAVLRLRAQRAETLLTVTAHILQPQRDKGREGQREGRREQGEEGERERDFLNVIACEWSVIGMHVMGVALVVTDVCEGDSSQRVV